MLDLEDIEKWPDPVEMGKSQIRKVIGEVKRNLTGIKAHLDEYELKYDLYLKSKFIESKKKSLTPLYENLSKVNTLFNKLLNQEKIEAAKKKIEEVNRENNELEKTCYWRGRPVYLFEDHLAWHTKERWDFDFSGQKIETYSERTTLMKKEEGKKWMIDNELKPLEDYLKRLEKELNKRES